MHPTATALLLTAVALPLWATRPSASARLTGLAGARRRALSPASPRAAAAAATGTVTGTLVAVAAGWPGGLFAGALAACAAWWLVHRRATIREPAPDPLALAATWDLLAACLRAGLPVPTAVRAVAEDLPGDASRALRATADLLGMGADPVEAWAPALECPPTAALARGARHTARSGTALSDVVTALAVSVRDGAGDAAEARAQRAGVLVAAPLGLCFLPAFVCLGVIPVVVGLATRLTF